MGNALSFLDEKRKRPNWGQHNTECKAKMEKHVAEFGTTKLEDYTLIKSGVSDCNGVNARAVYKGSIDGINARRFKNREEEVCKSCNKSFTPKRLSRPATLREKKLGMSDFTIWCEECSRRGKAHRDLLSRVGGADKLIELRERNMLAEDIRGVKSLRVLFEQLDIKTALGRGTKSVLGAIDDVIETAWKENENHTIRNSHHEFDF